MLHATRQKKWTISPVSDSVDHNPLNPPRKLQSQQRNTNKSSSGDRSPAWKQQASRKKERSMSVLPNGRGEGETRVKTEQESFNKFFECWLSEQDRHLQELIAASRRAANGEEAEEQMKQLVNGAMRHYEQYYRRKARSAKQDVLAVLSPEWTSKLEDAFLWIGGWRPSMAFHLLYSKAGLQLEAQLPDLLRGVGTGDLGDMRPGQLEQVDELHRRTIKEEVELTEKMAKQQETVADSTMVQLSHAMTEMRGEEEEDVETALGEKEEGLERILAKADELRLQTLRGVIEILDPLQAVHFLIAAAELHLRLHEWGKRHDSAARNHH